MQTRSSILHARERRRWGRHEREFDAEEVEEVRRIGKYTQLRATIRSFPLVTMSIKLMGFESQ